jgi:hypothetical protein
MKFLIMISDETTEEKVFCDNESEATAVIEQKVRDGISESAITAFSMEAVQFEVERVPVVKISDSAAVKTSSPEPEVPDFRAEATEAPAAAPSKEGSNPFLSEQVFSLDS